MLAQGSDAALKELATAEMRKPTAAEEQKKLGDGWWDLGREYGRIRLERLATTGGLLVSAGGFRILTVDESGHREEIEMPGRAAA